MNTEYENSGKCLCGAVRIKVESNTWNTNACHCGMCLTWGGGPFMAVGGDLKIEIEGEENITTFNSSEWAERGFCSKCGTHLFYRLKATSQYSIPAGFLHDKSRIQFQRQYFTDEKPSYYSFSNSTENLTREEVFEKYAPK